MRWKIFPVLGMPLNSLQVLFSSDKTFFFVFIAQTLNKIERILEINILCDYQQYSPIGQKSKSYLKGLWVFV